MIFAVKSRGRRKTMTGRKKTKTEIEPPWHAAEQWRRGRITRRRESSVDLCYYFIYYFTLIHGIPRRGREPQGVQTTRACRWHCDNFGPRRWRTHRSFGSNEKAAFGLFRYYNNIITLYCDYGDHVQHPIPLHDNIVWY